MTPDNGGFATAAYILAGIVYLAYAVSITVRERRLRARLAQLESSARHASHSPDGV
ncbi:MAG: hypothetical protein ABIP93_11360 [Gemmatimonadaceae bacterium]